MSAVLLLLMDHEGLTLTIMSGGYIYCSMLIYNPHKVNSNWTCSNMKLVTRKVQGLGGRGKHIH